MSNTVAAAEARILAADLEAERNDHQLQAGMVRRGLASLDRFTASGGDLAALPRDAWRACMVASATNVECSSHTTEAQIADAQRLRALLGA